MRLFIALPVSEEIRERCRVLQRKGRKLGLSMRWCRPEQIHLTLVFLGKIDDTQLSVLEQAIRTTAARTSPFNLAISALGVFPKSGAPRVLWAGVSEEKSLMELHRMLSEKIAELGIPVEKRPYRPHLTLARTRGITRPSASTLLRWDKQDENLEIGSCVMQKIILMESRLNAEGPEYHPLLTLPFG